MKKSLICIFIAMLVSVNLWGFSDPKNSLEWLMGANSKLDGLRVALAAVLALSLLIPVVRSKPARMVAVSTGIICLIVILGSVFFLSTTDALYVNMYPLDFITGMEAAVVLIMLGVNSQPSEGFNIRGKRSEPIIGFKQAKTA